MQDEERQEIDNDLTKLRPEDAVIIPLRAIEETIEIPHVNFEEINFDEPLEAKVS